MPETGISILKNSIITLYTAQNDTRVSVEVPNLEGLTIEEAQSKVSSKNLNLTFTETTSSGIISSQDIKPNSLVEEGTVIKVTIKSE